MLTRPKTLRTWIASGALAVFALAPRAADATGADPAAATPSQKSDAQKRFDKGRDLSAAKRYPEALAEFQASFDIVASPNTHFSIARTLASMGQLAEAYVEFGKTVAESQAALTKDKRYAQTAEAAEAEQRDLRAKLAFLIVSVENADNATVKIDDREFDRTTLGAAIPMTPGTHTVLVSSGGVELAKQTVTLATADRKTVVLDAHPKSAAPVAAEPPPEREQPVVAVDTSPGGLRTVAYVAGGVGVAGLATFGIFGALEKGTFNELKETCHGGPCPPERADDISKGRSQQMIANVGLAAGLVGAAASVVLFVVSAPAKSPTSARASLVVSPTFVGVGGSL